jgi:3-dehydroquinate dehydratase type I
MLRKYINEKKVLSVLSKPIRRINEIDYVIENFNRFNSDIIELRLDYLDNIILLENLKREINLPIIATIRDIEEGGVREVNEDDKIRILNHLSSLGFIIDVELFFYKRWKNKLKLNDFLLSEHYIQITPYLSDLLSSASYAINEGAALYKVAVSTEQALPLLFILLFEMKRKKYPVSLMPIMSNREIRAALAIAGSNLIYCHSEEKTSYGQIDISICNKIVEIARLLN